ncbi:hypothetical protein CH330_07690 [candidate division WOR-3 bacterium JGI_Cruoil_03_51_56]|uniref:Uncharacterized protein n=1 Tax=candidate division WOR-3 bacterium JGI_Cruoil_03_51_56 TaxID=1973747 RepID=A0A235BRD2_UNCW3|nr:MAG: hypothetical protein CH330_07690 [candidate division WOR-3 bacterium JGI_Cruoil_03_51_56]
MSSHSSRPGNRGLTAWLDVDRQNFRRAVRFLRKTSTLQDEDEVILSYRNGSLEVTTIGTSALVDATGSWPGHARTKFRKLNIFSRLSYRKRKLRFEVRDDELRLETVKIHCFWYPTKESPIILPLYAPLLKVLGLQLKYSDEQLINSGVMARLLKALREKEQLIESATRALRELGVEDAESVVRKLAEEGICKVNESASSNQALARGQQGGTNGDANLPRRHDD